MQCIEGLAPGVHIGWKLKFTIKERLINEVWTEDLQYKNISVGKKRLEFLIKISEKYGCFGENSFWNGDLANLVKLHFIPTRLYLPGMSTPTSWGYHLELDIAQHLTEFDALFEVVAEVSNAQYSSWSFVDTNDNLFLVNKALERNLSFDARFPDQHQFVQELALHLPHLKNSNYVAYKRAVPRILWQNYWNAETAKFYNFPDPQQDERIMPLAKQLSNGGWRFKLTKEPLDILRADHREAIIWAYRRFQPVGMTVEEFERSTPSQSPNCSMEDLQRILEQPRKTISQEEQEKAIKKLRQGIKQAAKKISSKHNEKIEANTLTFLSKLKKK